MHHRRRRQAIGSGSEVGRTAPRAQCARGCGRNCHPTNLAEPGCYIGARMRVWDTTGAALGVFPTWVRVGWRSAAAGAPGPIPRCRGRMRMGDWAVYCGFAGTMLGGYCPSIALLGRARDRERRPVRPSCCAARHARAAKQDSSFTRLHRPTTLWRAAGYQQASWHFGAKAKASLPQRASPRASSLVAGCCSG